MTNSHIVRLLISHEDTEQMKTFADAVDADSLLKIYLPMFDSYKWDIQRGDFFWFPGAHRGFAIFIANCNPPTELFEELWNRGFTISALFEQPDEGLCCQWQDGTLECIPCEDDEDFCWIDSDETPHGCE